MLKYICRNKSKKMMQDLNLFSLKEFYNSIPDYNDINHLNEQQFYEKLEFLKKKQHELTKCTSKRRKRCEYFHGCNELKLEPLNLEECSNNSIVEFERVCKVNSRMSSKLPDAEIAQRPKSCTMRKKKPDSRLSNVDDDYELLKSLKNYRSKSISPTRLSNLEAKISEAKLHKDEKDDKFYSDLTNDQLSPVDHHKKRTAAAKDIPITSRIPLYDMVVADQKHKNQLAKLDSAIKLQSQMKPFHFNESKNTARKCLSRSFSTPHLNFTDNDSEMDSSECFKFKATPFPKNLFCNYVHYKMWEDNYFRALNKKLRAEELLKLSKLPPSMAKREHENKIKDLMVEESRSTSMQQHQLPEISKKKKKMRKKIRRPKSSFSNSKKIDFTTQSYKSYVFDGKKKDGKDRSSVKSDATSFDCKKDDKMCPTPLYPVNRPNLAAVLRYEWSREKMKQMKDDKDRGLKDKYQKPMWGVKQSHAFQQMTHETSNAEEIAMRLATRRAEQRLRQEEHQLNMDMIRHRVKQKPLLLEGQQQLLDFGLPSHNCDTPVNKPKNHCNAPVLIKTHIFSKQPRLKRPGSSKLSLSSTDSKTSTLSNSKFN